jgi:hypothetical protein
MSAVIDSSVRPTPLKSVPHDTMVALCGSPTSSRTRHQRQLPLLVPIDPAEARAVRTPSPTSNARWTYWSPSYRYRTAAIRTRDFMQTRRHVRAPEQVARQRSLILERGQLS